MKGVALLLVALAACAGLCSALNGLPSMKYQGGYSCEGKIALLDCYAPDGFVTALLYQNTNDPDATAICDYPFVNGEPVLSSNTLELDVDESIIAVEACRGAFYGYTKITVTTDKNRVWTCGGGSSKYPTRPGSYGNGCGGWSAYTKYGCYQPYDYTSKYGQKSKWGQRLTRGLLSAEDASTEGSEGRELLQEQEATEDTFWLKRNLGWGWNGGSCQTYRSPRQPKWSTCGGSRCVPWWSGTRRSSGTFGYASTHFKYSGWTAPNGYYQWNNGGKRTVYYKSRTLYNKYTSYCKTSRCSYTPADYYGENYPLASFSGICDKNGALYNLYGFCWNNDYTPPPPPAALVVTMRFISDAGQPCINIVGTPPPPINVNAVTGQIKRYIDIVSPGLLKEIVFYPAGYSCTPGSANTNATTVINFGFVPGPNKTVADIVNFFTAAQLGVGADVCALPPIPDPVTGVSFSPCVTELFAGIVAGIPESGLTKKSKKRVNVKAVTDNILKASQYRSYWSRYGVRKAKKTLKAYSTKYFGSALYATAYVEQFPKGYSKANKKMPDYKTRMEKVKQTYTAWKKRGL